MTTCSTFTAALTAAEGRIARSVWLEIKRDGRDRLIERLRAGEADSALDFTDLLERIVAAEMPH